MGCGEGTAIIGCSPRQMLEFVLDVERYRLADRKIGRVHWVRRDGNHGQVKHNGRLLGVATPPIVLAFTLTPWSHLDFGIVTAPWPALSIHSSAPGSPVTHPRRLSASSSSWSATKAPEPRRRTSCMSCMSCRRTGSGQDGQTGIRAAARWTIERTGAWLGGWRRPRIHHERSSELGPCRD
jgi:hypothetical protein